MLLDQGLVRANSRPGAMISKASRACLPGDNACHIEGIQRVATDTVATMQDIGSTISEVNEIAAAIASAVEEQNSATQEIANNLRQAAA